MPRWLIEDGIGETRAVLVEDGEVLAARLFLPGETRAGAVLEARLVARQSGSRRGTVRLPSGEDALIDGLEKSASEGALLRIVVTRSAIREGSRIKRMQVRPTDKAPCPPPTPREELERDGFPVEQVRRFPDDPWPELVLQALDGQIPFPGGTLLVSPTPAMTLIDIDGALPPATLAMAAVPAIAACIGQLDLNGAIGIDFPSLERKDDRRAVDTALAAALDHWPHQSTAMNGFGFVQLVARCEGPSLLHRVHNDPAGAGARLLLRRAEAVSEPGILLLGASSAVRAAVRPEWEEELARRTGRTLRWSVDDSLALGGGFAQAVAS
ncbi:ribonuclease [Novosphingobium profundi]|uniref:ribonuclease n=1 Tax=Novosphingobium profundi TaxID=1774954 RepID=UPI001CFE7DF5|nr:ribonuclease [Novosphingobium profundi]